MRLLQELQAARELIKARLANEEEIAKLIRYKEDLERTVDGLVKKYYQVSNDIWWCGAFGRHYLLWWQSKEDGKRKLKLLQKCHQLMERNAQAIERSPDFNQLMSALDALKTAVEQERLQSALGSSSSASQSAATSAPSISVIGTQSASESPPSPLSLAMQQQRFGAMPPKAPSIAVPKSDSTRSQGPGAQAAPFPAMARSRSGLGVYRHHSTTTLESLQRNAPLNSTNKSTK